MPNADEIRAGRRPAVSPEDLEAEARAVLSPTAYDYYAGGAEDEVTLVANRKAFERWRFRYRVLAGGAEPDLSVEIFGKRISLPVLLAPTAVHGLAHVDGELATARAAARAGTTFCLSTLASRTIEDVAAAAPAGARWFQLYIYRDRGVTGELVDRAAAAGYQAIELTADFPVAGRRDRDMRNAFALPDGVTYANLAGGARTTVDVQPGESGLAKYVAGLLDPTIGWSDLEWLVERSPVPVLVKGVVRGDDAEHCISHGAAGLVVSNHGGRQLDSSIASIDALPEVVEAAGSRVPVLIDGGVRRGTDVLKAICLGATAVQVGRPYLWALAVDGEHGVLGLIEQLRDELTVGMALLGASSLADLNRDLLSRWE
ncbi:MAG TPA: alpha-hydroxy acid oxidase [Candidatus Solibacter sp.]|jgi:4-hydroxymandelate oxidase|nr:alpha-hydroxy acid oxidase [Candidatus Solibacter sp.]